MSQKSTPGDGNQSMSTLNSLWDEIGYTQEEKDERTRKINADIEEVRSKFIESTLRQCQKVKEETEQIRSTHISMLKAIDAPEEQINLVKENGRKGTIKEKYDAVKAKFKEFSKIYNQRYSEFEKLQKQIDNCFTSIGITDPSEKGEFAEIGENDLTPARLRRFEDKVNQLTNEVDSRLLQFISLKKQILSMNSELQEELPSSIEKIFSKQIYSDQVLEKLKEYISYLKELLNTRRQYISEMAVEINRLWDLLGTDELTKRQFLASHNTLSQKNVQDCIDEADRLTKIRNQRLPEIIEKMKFDLSVICQSLGYSKQKEKEICNKCEQIEENPADIKKEDTENQNSQEVNQSENPKDDINIEEEEDINIEEEEDINIDEVKETDIEDPKLLQIFNNFSNELVHLRKTLIFAQPIIDLINQREQIINDYDEVINKPDKVSEIVDNQSDTSEVVKIRRYDQLNGKNIRLKNQRVRLPDHREKLHSEKVIRRHKFVLPRIEKKLYIMLIQFREEQKGEDFLWKDKPIIDELGHIQVTQDEINQNRIRFNKFKKRVDMNNDGDGDRDAVKSPSKHRKSMFVNHDKIEPKNSEDDPRRGKSPRKSAFPKKLKKIVNDE